jgi:hypothetical protein
MKDNDAGAVETGDDVVIGDTCMFEWMGFRAL